MFSPLGHPTAASRAALVEWTRPLLATASSNAHEQANAVAAGLAASGATPAAARVEFKADSPSVMHGENCTWGGGGGVLAGGACVAVADGPENQPCTSASRSVCDWLKNPRPRFDT